MTPVDPDDKRRVFWNGVAVGMVLGIPATAGAAWMVFGVNVLFWWI